ncbi:MAG: fumarylacetoacetate hydrolase family protein [Pseudomonadota bacterium]
MKHSLWSDVSGRAAVVAAAVFLYLLPSCLQAQETTRYVRYTDGVTTSYGILDGETVHELDGDLFGNPQPTGRTEDLADVFLLLPVDPRSVTHVVGVAGNTSWRADSGRPRPTVLHPRWFTKSPTSLNTWNGDIEIYPEAENLDWEGELVLVIGKKGRHISVEDAPDYIFGVTVGNDVSENTWYSEGMRMVEGSSWPRSDPNIPTKMLSKSPDTWAVLGKSIVTGIDYSDLRITIKQNDVVVGDGRTSNMINSPARLVSYLSRYITLLPGDLIYTGTVPSTDENPGRMVAGDVVEVEIEQVGMVRNTVVEVTEPFPLKPLAAATDE